MVVGICSLILLVQVSSQTFTSSEDDRQRSSRRMTHEIWSHLEEGQRRRLISKASKGPKIYF